MTAAEPDWSVPVAACLRDSATHERDREDAHDRLEVRLERGEDEAVQRLGDCSH